MTRFVFCPNAKILVLCVLYWQNIEQVYFDIFYKIHFSIIISPAREWYLSGYGNNTADCGDSRENACKTLDHLLGLFHKTSFKQNQTLVLITNETLLINTKLMVRRNVLMSV